VAKKHSGIRRAIREFLGSLEADNIRIQEAYLFGSYARGSAKEWSDIDLAVISQDFSGNRHDDMMRLIQYQVSSDTRIEPIPFHPDDFDGSDPLAAEILSHGIRVWPEERG
jgi:predicted nucleotidyltransferase